MKHSFKLLSFIVISLFFLNTLTGCGSSKKKNKKNKVQQKHENTMKVDTSTVKPLKEKLSPGTALVTARVIMYNESNPYQVTIKVLSVRGYGSATPHLPQKADMKVDISKGLLNKHDLNEIKNEFTLTKPITVLLRSNQGMAMGKHSGPSWTIIDYH